MRYIYLSLAIVFGLMVLACTGQSLGENDAGDDTYLEGIRPTEEPPPLEHYQDGQPDSRGGCVYRGAIAVDHRTETAFVLQTHSRLACGADWDAVQAETPRKIVYGVRPGARDGEAIADLSGSRDARMLFPNGRVLIMAEYADQEKYLTFDPVTLELVSTVGPPPGVRYHGTRMSPSRRYVAVADNAELGAPVHVFDTQTLATRVIPHDGDHIEAQWLHGTDTLVAFVFYDLWRQGADGVTEVNPNGYARVLAWSFEETSPLLAVERDGLWTDPILDLRVDGVSPDYFGSWSWVTVSDNDRYLALPYLSWDEAGESTTHQTLVVDMRDESTSVVPFARGIAAFSKDSRSLISWSAIERDGESRSALMVVDLATMWPRSYEPSCVMGSLRFHVVRGGRFVAVDGGCGMGLHMFDLDRGAFFKAPDGSLHLNEYVDRTETEGALWLVGHEGLRSVDVESGAVDAPEMDWLPERINHLPQRGHLVLTDKFDNRLVYFDPETREELHEARLRPHFGALDTQRPTLRAPNFVVEAAVQLDRRGLNAMPGFRDPICLECR